MVQFEMLFEVFDPIIISGNNFNFRDPVVELEFLISKWLISLLYRFSGMDEDIINEIACGSSHCIAWHSLLPAHNAKHEPVIFENVKDSLGASLLHFYDKETTDTVNHSVQNCSNIYPMSNYPLGELVLSIDNNFKKQQALQFIIETIQIQQSRQCVIKALISHKIAQELASNDMITSGIFKNLI